MITINEYQDQYQEVFKKINLYWLDKYKLTESHDLMILDDPKKTILDQGGAIYLAMDDARVVGSAAITIENDGSFELAKMVVIPEYQGRGISKLLITACLEKARELGAKKLILFSNHQLVSAIALYSKFGFKHVEVTNSPFLTADIKMELNL